MNVKFSITISWLVLISYFSSGIVCAENKVDDYFAMSPAELAATPVTIAAGTPKPIFQSATATRVIIAEQIKFMRATELRKVLETVPGIHASLQALTYDYNYIMRRIRNATNSQILMLLNGTRITTPFRSPLMTSLELPIVAIQRVELIRGPGSALYGAEAFTDVINIITKKTRDIGGANVDTRTGDHSAQSDWGQYGGQRANRDVATNLQYQHISGDDGRIINTDSQTPFDKKFGTQASHAPKPMNTRYETLNGHLVLQREHWDIGLWAFNSIDAGALRAERLR